MAEFSGGGLLAALLLFTALTVKDVYVGMHRDQSRDQQEQGRPAKPWSSSGSYSKVFQDYSRAINQIYPELRIEGSNYPPTTLNKYLGNLIFYLKLLALVLIVSGTSPFRLLNTEPTESWARIWTWTQQNKIFSCLMAFFICNMLETHFLSTGAFEISLNDVPVWSKLQSGYVLNIQELFQILDSHLKMNQAPVFT
uniref:Selenoprotein T n=1 Tax=Periophthalmus magnuspinnatus TaxID=409849 RepID=A0A3B4BBA2_9GOBI